ncbi:MAG: sterol desaturase family protein, partial [Verrucomicrobium sp.]
HHEYYRGNYGLYFNVWDRLMGTNHEKYEERFAEVTNRPKATVKPVEQKSGAVDEPPSPSATEVPSPTV